MRDWKQIGLKCGLELHIQLEGTKLFCNCATEIREDDPHFTVRRQLRAVAGESGDVDIAALKEIEKGKHFVYQGYIDSTCLVELDEQPPNALNKDALKTALQVAKMMNMHIVDQAHVMRKTVVDGSNTSGFQRTSLIAHGGEISTSKGSVRIASVCIEEDASKIIRKEKDFTVYRLDRLGIPLLEIATEPDITTPDQCLETAERIGLLVRSTGKSKRGLGTIRQDVNVSIRGGNRIEIKGAQELKLVPTLVTNEALRQEKLIEIKNELTQREANPIPPQIVDVSALFKKSDAKIISNTLANNGVIYALKLAEFTGLLGKEVQPGKRLGSEMSDRAKVAAGVGGIFHSDELPKYGITDADVDAVMAAVDGKSNHDAFVLVAAGQEKAKKALAAVIERADEALQGVPKEVRKANPDGTTSFLRPMPGAARMYPETDIPTIPLSREWIKSIVLPELIDERAKRYEKLGLGRDLATLAARHEQWETFDAFVNEFNSLKSAYVAEVFFGAAKTIKRQDNIDINPTKEDFLTLFKALADEKISKESVLEILKKGKPVALVINKFKVLSDDVLERELRRIVKQNKDIPFNALIGKAMGELRGKASGQKIMALLKKLHAEQTG